MLCPPEGYTGNGIAEADFFLTDGCPSYNQANNLKALKGYVKVDGSVYDGTVGTCKF